MDRVEAIRNEYEGVPVIGVFRLRLGTDGDRVTTLVAFHGCNLRCRYFRWNESTPQSITASNSKFQIDTLKCTLEEFAVLREIENNPKITQTDIAKSIKKSASTVKRITSALVDKGIMVRRNGRRNGWWKILSE